ncbi:MAG: ADP-dependent glucokinase/phosphofructokinase [Spirochaetia bacterium]
MGERIVLGLGDNTDYEIVWDSLVFEQLILENDITDAELRPDRPISNTRELLISILGFLKSETGGERFVSSPLIIEEFASRFQNRITIGGTSVRAAIAMRKLGFTSALHLVTVNDHVRKLIPRDCPWVCSNETDSSYPHLIVQFGRDTSVQAGDISIRTKRANRIIYDNDYDNIVMKINPAYASLASSARVFLISGFNAMQSSELLADRLEKLLDVMRALPSDALVFYEDACFHEPALSGQVRKALIDVIDIYSLNEDELQGYAGKKISLLDPEGVHAALRDMQGLLPVPVLVVHTQYWALAFGSHASRYAKALKGGITMATTRFRFGDDFTRAQYAETERLPAEARGADFAAALGRRAGDMVCCLPSVQVEESTVTTIGLGDAFVGGFLPALVER